METTEVRYGEAITKITRIFNFYLKEARRRDALDGNHTHENRFWELQDSNIKGFKHDVSQIFIAQGLEGKCPEGLKGCNGICIPESEECLAL